MCVGWCCRSRVSSARFQRPLLVLEASHGVSWAELIRNIRWMNTANERETRARDNPRDQQSEEQRKNCQLLGRTYRQYGETGTARWNVIVQERRDESAFAIREPRKPRDISVLGDDSSSSPAKHGRGGWNFCYTGRGEDSFTPCRAHVYIVLPNLLLRILLLAYNSDSIRGIRCAHYYLHSELNDVTQCPTDRCWKQQEEPLEFRIECREIRTSTVGVSKFSK